MLMSGTWWTFAACVSGCLRARLAIEHMTHEARGLDVLPQTVQRLRNGHDSASAQLLWDVIYQVQRRSAACHPCDIVGQATLLVVVVAVVVVVWLLLMFLREELALEELQ